MIEETADLWFHTMVLLANENIDTRKILKELEDRFGISGIVEKSSRKENI
jgi:phosphoribosyl-ATP pyrophosphohydrolase